MIDTHAHLDALADPHGAIERAEAAGVARIIAIGSGIDSVRATHAIAERWESVFVTAGVHPHQAGDGENVRAVVGQEVVAIGEIGLDYFRDYAPREAQRRVFSEQLELAHELGKPVVVHCRAAEEETAASLASFEGTVVLHCFSSPQLLPVALGRGYYLSFAGNVTYPNADDLRAAAAAVPPDRILAETDSPYLSPQPVRGRPNEPAHVVHTIATLAEARGEAMDELGQRIAANAARAFSLP